MKWALRPSLVPSTSRRSRVAWQRWEAVGVAARSSQVRGGVVEAAVGDRSEVAEELRIGHHRAAVLAEARGTTLLASRA